jgi:predicted nucleic acid-binding protein
MIGNKILIDTNIAINLFKGDENLGRMLQNVEAYVSFIVELELKSYGKLTLREQDWIQLFLDECIIVDINQGIKELATKIRRTHFLKLPDAIIAATAIFLNVPLISNDDHFEKVTDLKFIYYEL